MRRNCPDPVRMVLQQPDWLTDFANLRAYTHEVLARALQPGEQGTEQVNHRRGDRGTR